MKGQFTQPVQVRPQDVSVHLSSDPSGGEGDQAVEASGTPARYGGSASVRAATRVKPEQASKGLMRAPSPLSMDEGRCGRLDAPTDEGRPQELAMLDLKDSVALRRGDGWTLVSARRTH